MRRRVPALAAVALAVLVQAAPAAAHGSLSPTAAPGGVAQRFELTVPNDRLDADIVGVTLELPQGAIVESAEARQPRWAVTSSESSVRWTGGPIESSTTETFAFVARLASGSGSQAVTLVESYDDGDGAPFPLTLAAIDDVGAGGNDETVAVAALALAALALLVATIELALAARMRRAARA